MNSLIRDINFAIRQLRKKPGFALITILTLGLGIGATTAIFSLVNTVVLRPLPFPRSDRIMNIATGRQAAVGAPIRPGSFDYPDFFDFRAQNKTFDSMASFRDTNVTLTGRGEPRHTIGEVVASDFFRVLGVTPALGRDFTRDDEKPHSNVVILSHDLWESTFSSDPNIVGKAITLNETNYTIVGVMPRGFVFPFTDPPPTFYTTLGIDAYAAEGGPTLTNQRGAHFLEVIGRAKSGVSVQQAQADLTVIAGNLRKQYPETNERFPAAVVRTELERLVGSTRSTLAILFAAVGFVLLIACANVAGLLIARVTQRKAEFAVRSAIGAGRWEIIRQVLIESLVLAFFGGLAGIVFASVSLSTLIHLVPQDLPRLTQVSVDRDALSFALGVSFITAAMFGVFPAWRLSRLQPSQSIRQGSRSVTADRGQHRLQNILIVSETAIGLILLLGSALLIHTFLRVLRVDPGFDSHHVLTASLSLPDSRYPALKTEQFYRELMPLITNLPGVVSASAGTPLPLSNNGMVITIQFQGRLVPKGQEPAEAVAIVTPGYFRTMRIPVLEGREFQETDTTKSQAVVLVTQSFARKYYPGENAIGKYIKPGIGDGVTKSDTMRQIVGIVGDVKTNGLTADLQPQYYLPESQAIDSPSLIIRTQGEPTALMPAVRAAVGSLDKSIPLFEVRTMDDYVSRSAAQSRFQAVLLTCFAGIALLLFAVGLYALLSYTVAQRTVEIGVRMALGAKRQDMLMMFLRKGLQLTLIGAVIGLLASFGLSRVISSMLYEVKATDPASFIAVAILLMIVALFASAIPAVRAMSVNPINALKDE